MANVSVEASLSVGGPVIAQTTSDSSGNYSLDIPTGGRPISPVLSLRSSGFMDGTWAFDAPIVASIASFYSPMGQPNDVDTLYSAGGGGTRDPAKGTIYFEVTDCAGARVNGVTISVSPPASRIAYAGPAGIPSTIYSTTTSSGRAWAFNVPAGIVTVSASKSGVTFLSHTITVLPGDNFMGTRLRPIP